MIDAGNTGCTSDGDDERKEDQTRTRSTVRTQWTSMEMDEPAFGHAMGRLPKTDMFSSLTQPEIGTEQIGA